MLRHISRNQTAKQLLTVLTLGTDHPGSPDIFQEGAGQSRMPFQPPRLRSSE